MTWETVASAQVESCCAAEPVVLVKPHSLTDGLIGGRYVYACFDHLEDVVMKETLDMLGDPKRSGVSVMRP